MKYILLIYHNDASRKAIEADFEGIVGEVDTLIQELTATGEWVGGDGLAVEAKSVRVRNGVPAITDGPYLEAKEYLAGYSIVDCESMERALEIAARWPDSRFTGLEVRPLMGEGGEEM